ncbi:MAG: uroporphyrinogen-III synthase [Deltaproteobacteria bacterium]|nr:uroporphyrinogen-III synthase [Deltaproteobacteria bacterium]
MINVLVTNPRPHCKRLAVLLRAKGCTVAELPLWEVVPPSDGGAALRAVCARLDDYDWITFTSRFAIEAFVAIVSPRSRRIAVVGPETAALLQRAGFTVECVADPATAEGLVKALAERGVSDAKILVVQGSTARQTLAEGLRRVGAIVECVDAYEMRPTAVDPAWWIRENEIARYDAVAFTAPSAVERFVELFGPPKGVPPFAAASWLAIGPTTADALKLAGLAPIYQPREPTFAALADLVANIPVDSRT